MNEAPLAFLWRGILLGFAIAAPVGPIGVLCIRRTLIHGRLAGFVSGLGAATADAFYGGIAGFGLTAISGLLVYGQTWLRLVGGAFLCYLGVRTLLTRRLAPRGRLQARATIPGYLAAYASTLFLTLSNPMTILSFAAIFAGLGLAGERAHYGQALALVAGVFSGSALWWLVLSGLAGVFRQSFLSPPGMRWVNRLAGAVILAFGLLTLASLLPWKGG